MKKATEIQADGHARAVSDCQDSARPRVVILGPSRGAVSGVSEHLNQLFASRLSEQVELIHFQVGSEGRSESGRRRVWRQAIGPVQLAYLLIRTRAAAIHLNTSIDRRAFWRDLLYLLVAKALRRKVVYQIHGGALPIEIQSHSAILGLAFSVCLRLPDAIVVLTADEETQYRATARGTPVLRIPNAVDLAPYADFPARDYSSRTPLRLVYIGRLAKDKGLYETLEAMALLSRRGAAGRIRLTLAGSGSEEQRLRKAVVEFGLDSLVEIIGPVFGEKKRIFWRNADLFIFPTRREGLPYAVLESLAAGTPLVTTRAGGIPDAIENGVHGVFLDTASPGAVADTVSALLENSETLRHMSDACRQRAAERYGLSRLEHQLCELYRSMLSDTSPCGSEEPPAHNLGQRGIGDASGKKGNQTGD
ncbi:MAG: glycosyltransferase family 4 protein [Acidobacteriaceae bacterium]